MQNTSCQRKHQMNLKVTKQKMLSCFSEIKKNIKLWPYSFSLHNVCAKATNWACCVCISFWEYIPLKHNIHSHNSLKVGFALLLNLEAMFFRGSLKHSLFQSGVYILHIIKLTCLIKLIHSKSGCKPGIIPAKNCNHCAERGRNKGLIGETEHNCPGAP